MRPPAARAPTRPARLRRGPAAPARRAAAAAAACRGCSRAATCRAAPATCGSDTTSPSGGCPGRAGRRASVVGQRDAPEVARRRRSESRSAAPAARSRTCSRRSAARRRCDPRAAGSRRTARSPAGTPRAGSRRSRGTDPASGATSRMFRSTSHWPAKFSTSAFDARIGQHAPDLLLEHGRILQPPALGRRRAARRRECCSRGRTTGATPARDR